MGEGVISPYLITNLEPLPCRASELCDLADRPRFSRRAPAHWGACAGPSLIGNNPPPNLVTPLLLYHKGNRCQAENKIFKVIILHISILVWEATLVIQSILCWREVT